MIHRFSPFINTDLDQHRLQATSNPRLTLSMWIYLLSWCGSKLCGIIQHVDHNNTFISPLILLTNTGDIVFQVRLTSGEDEAFRSHTALRLRTWYRLDCVIEGSMVILKISTTPGRRIRQHNYIFQNHIHLNDTDGYFVIGGGKYMPGINGYFGPIRYHRLKAKEVLNPLLPKRTLIQLDETHRMCGETKEAISAFLRALKESQQVTNTRMCRDLYTDLDYRFGRQVCRAPPWGRRAQKLYRPLLEFLQTEKPEDLSRLYGLGDRRGTLRIGARVFTLALRRLTPGDPPVFGAGVSVTSLLELSCCMGYHRAAYLLAVTHLAGLGVPTDTVQGHVYSLIGAQADDRLALMHLGYKHTQGIDGFPEDFAMAYSYYGNVGQQTCDDRWNVQSTKQYTAEHVLLTDDEALGYQTHQTDDIFQYLQFQAERGDISSQKTLARMLFWGQQGVSKDPGAAVKWFAKTAMEMGDAHSMYDYSILLFKGQGVKKNTTLALQLMQKAASEGLLEALNGMGWYYSHFMADAETALKYFEKAAKNGSRDAVYNLGVFHLNGNYTGKPGKNETAAFLHFLKAGLLGHYDATVLAAWYYATGNLQVAPRDTERAVWMLKHMSEKNGYLGHVLQKGLRAYLRGSRDKALLRYTIAAETGLSVAQTNAAHLCEELGPSYGCERRYYNYSTFNNLPHHTGFLKMGDYHYQGWRDSPQDLRLAISMYGRAGQHGSAQGIFNLAVLMEEGHRVPEEILEQLNISGGDLQDVDAVVEKLYKSCSQLDEDLDLSPCSLALFRVRLGRAWRSFMHHPVQSLLAYVIGSASVAALVTFVMQRVSNSGPAAHGIIQRAEPSPANHDEVIRNGQLGLVTQLLMRRRSLHLIGDWAITVMGVGLCTAYTLLLFRLL
ncbi:hypothetical protein AGOR_G00171850 [Albula goreensis]|uniref:Protein sel-1 homolog 3-like n=1 Tax=Albula goreensis TaxID=1534307 RepID=A0A8T3CXC8_9TELE|nr:hypothetical protein AGOR_G00171850 [Albula goreensis]